MIQYFATNRSLDQLANATSDRDARIKLSKGGYYFVNMDVYMRYYLATTDSSKMPNGAIIPDSTTTVFNGFLNDKRIGRIVICVHGFNVDLFEAYTWFRVLTDTMKHQPEFGARIVTSPADLKTKPATTPDGSLTAFIGFSWPSNGNVFSYMSDQREAIGTAPAFAALLAHLKTTGKSLNLICHSMGNFLACHAFAALINEVIVPCHALDTPAIKQLLARAELKDGTEEVTRTQFLVDNYVMIAPDVERRHVTKCILTDIDRKDDLKDYVGPFYSGLQHLVSRKVNIYSRFDSALSVSDLEKKPREAVLAVGDAISRWSLGLLDFLERNPDQRWEKRLGSAPAPVNAAPGFLSVNATEIAGRKIDHSDHVDAVPLAQSIAHELEV